MKIVFFLCALMVSLNGFEIPEGDTEIYSNNLNQIYISNSSELFLYSETGEHLYSFNEVSLGDISVVDVNLSLKPLLFYKDCRQ